MKKQATSFLAAVIAAAATIPMTASADVGTVNINGVTWTVDTNATTRTATLGDGSSACIATSTSIGASQIPWTFTVGEGDDTIEYTVTSIATSAFNGCSKLSGTLTIPNAVTSMGNYAFKDCEKLSKIASLGGLTKIPQEAFRNDSGLNGSDYPDMSRIESIGKNAFNYCKMGGTVKLDSLTGTSNCDSAFNAAAITNVIFPRRDINLTGNWMFQDCTKLTGVYFPGPDSGSSRAKIRRSACFKNCTSLKVFLAGPRTQLSNNYGATDQTMFTGVQGCKIFVPTGANWDTESDSEKGLAAYEANNAVFYYGAGRELDLAFNHNDHLITATPATVHAFTNVLASASTFKNIFGMDTRINVTNALEIAAGSITAADLAGVTFTSLIFAVKTQAQLNTVFAAVPAETPLAIDPEGATENLKINTVDRKVYVMLPKNGSYKVRKDGLVIVVN